MEKKDHSGFWFPAAGYIAIFAAGALLYSADFGYILRWYVMLLIFGIMAMPFSSYLFKGFDDKGFLFSKVIGLVVSSYVMWFFSSLHIIPFTFAGAVISLLAAALLLAFLPCILAKKGKIGALELPEARVMIIREAVFLGSFLLFMYFRCYRPSAFGQEKMMDYGIMNRLMDTEYMPPEDMWFSGESLNYYYFGQFVFTFLTKISGNTPVQGYNLGMCTAFAFYFSLPFCISIYLMREKCPERKKLQLYTGLFTGCISVFAGNMHYVLYGKITPAIREILQTEMSGDKYWFADSSRYIGHNPDIPDKTAVEFGSYSMITGDLHAHVINQIFVLAFLAILLSWLFRKKEEETFSLKKELTDPAVLFCAFLIGIFTMCNSWDAAIYFVVAGALLLSGNIRRFNKAGDMFKATLCQAVIFLLGLFIPAIPFIIHFVPMTGGVAFTTRRSRFYQLFVLWGLPVLLLTGFIRGIVSEKKEGGFTAFMKKLDSSELYIMITGLCAAGLIFLPEAVYVVDIYGDSYERFNTMFKLTYQSNCLFAVIQGVLVMSFVFCGGSGKAKKYGIIAFILIFVSFGYFFEYANAWLGDFTKASARKRLDAEAFIQEESGSDYRALKWIQQSIAPGSVMLEAQGDAYSLDDRMAVFAGTLTPAGWHTHEWLWHNDPDPINTRDDDVRAIYTGSDEGKVKELLEKYNVEYIYIGSREYEHYGAEGMNTDFLRSLGNVIYEESSADGRNVYVIDL
ncbi:MAG: hypothetical protein K5987_02850 [Lachnospiraceae bacterium]|nr:hypothetical protein [Lachnospiraceae bacterium]